MDHHEIHSHVQDTIIAILEAKENGVDTPETQALREACFDYRRWYQGKFVEGYQ